MALRDSFERAVKQVQAQPDNEDLASEWAHGIQAYLLKEETRHEVDGEEFCYNQFGERVPFTADMHEAYESALRAQQVISDCFPYLFPAVYENMVENYEYALQRKFGEWLKELKS